ncbi:hypothetical protein [Streptomyces sp. WM6373]|uniref:hypothetical protein n=1 Tax=Streptomyces sp. WM6373 TaxID=1415556 RepID=UPI0006AEBE22|nr:hypothetical protein [Streptomyces sp. WM6373]
MRSEDAVEIVRASLALAFPTASAEGLNRAAETVIRWGTEGVADDLNAGLTTRMLLDLLQVAGISPEDFRLAEPDHPFAEPAEYRTWSRTEGMPLLPLLPRPPDNPTTPHDPPRPDGTSGRDGRPRPDGPSGATPRQ